MAHFLSILGRHWRSIAIFIRTKSISTNPISPIHRQKNEKILTVRLSGFWESLNDQSTSARLPPHISGKLGKRWIWDLWLI
jgi:hypothetical protein